MIKIRYAVDSDKDSIIELLKEVLEVHSLIRPDIFKSGTTKYTKDEVENIINDKNRITLVALEDDTIVGYIMGIIKKTNNHTMHNFSYLYIDDICVNEKERGKGIGTMLFEYIKNISKELGLYEITLNVWEGNDKAKEFYKKLGLKIKEIEMELII